MLQTQHGGRHETIKSREKTPEKTREKIMEVTRDVMSSKSVQTFVLDYIHFMRNTDRRTLCSAIPEGIKIC